MALYAMPRLLATRRASELALFAAVAGMTLGLAPFVIPSLGIDTFFLQGAGGFVSALGSAVFTVLWGRRYASFDMARIERMAAASLILSFACYAALIVSPRPLATLFIYCLPFCSAACLVAGESTSAIAGEKQSAAAFPNKVAATESLGNLNVAGFMRLGLGVIGATTVVSLFWSFANNGIVPIPDSMLTLSLLSGLLVAALIEVYVYRFSQSLNLGTLYRWVLPLIAAAFSLTLFGGSMPAICAALLVNAMQALLNLTTFVYFAELSKRTGASAVRVFGLGRFFLESGFLVGMVLFPAIEELGQRIGFYQGALFIALTGFIVLVMFSIASQDLLAFALEGAEENGAEGKTLKTQDDHEAAREPNDTNRVFSMRYAIRWPTNSDSPSASAKFSRFLRRGIRCPSFEMSCTFLNPPSTRTCVISTRRWIFTRKRSSLHTYVPEWSSGTSCTCHFGSRYLNMTNLHSKKPQMPCMAMVINLPTTSGQPNMAAAYPMNHVPNKKFHI